MNQGNYQGNREKRKKRILWMILVPAVLAVILLGFSAFLSDRYEKMAQEEKKGISSEADLSAEERETGRRQVRRKPP